MQKKILPRFDYTRKEIKEIVHAISAHSRSGGREEPKTLEAKIVYDADKLDGPGAFGIARARALCGARGYDQKQTARWYLARIMDVAKNRPLYTQYGKRIAKSKLKTSLAFCRKVLGKEYDNIMAEAFGGKPVRL